MTKAKTANPFDDLDSRTRKITPKKLAGEPLRLWEQLVRKWKKGELKGLPQHEIHNWAVKHLGLTCTRYCTRQCLINDAENVQ